MKRLIAALLLIPALAIAQVTTNPGVTGVVTSYATSAQGAKADTALQPNTAIAVTSVSLGTTPALSGPARLPNNTIITARNAANSADLNVVGTDANNVYLLGQSVGISLTDSTTLNLGAIGGGLLVLVSNVDVTCLFVISSAAITELSDPEAKCSTSAGTGTSTNVYNSAGSTILENKNGATRSYYAAIIK